jgi:alkylation response protein AidB-like acyl-CoA dehydrogenase
VQQVPNDYDFTPEETQFRHEVRAFLADALPADWVSLFSARDTLETSNRVTRELADKGWLIQHWPARYGGQDGSIWMQAVAQEEYWAHGEPRGGQYMNVNWIGPAILHFGTEEQKHELLAPIMEGRVTWAQLFSEPGAGSDLGGIGMSAVLEGDHFVLNGQKTWTSYGGFASKGFLVARTDPGSKRREGLSVLLIDLDCDGIETREIRSSLGVNRIYEEFFTDVRVPRSCLLGDLHDGWRVAMAALGFERSGSSRYARATRVLGHLEKLPGADDPEIQRELAGIMAQGRAAELMNYRVIALKEEGHVPTWEASAARVHNARYEQRVAALAERLLGMRARLSKASAATTAEAEIASLVTSQAPTITITAGTLEIQLGIVAQRRLGMERTR